MTLQSCQPSVLDWHQLQLFGIEPRRTADPPPFSESTDRPADFLRQRLAYSSARQRQGIAHRGAMPPAELQAVARQLRVKAEQGDPQAILVLLGMVAGLPPGLVPAVPVTTASNVAVTLNPVRGWLSLDYAKVFLAGAAEARDNGSALAASHLLLKPLPMFLAGIVHAAYKRKPSAWSVGDLFGSAVPGPHEPLDGDRHGRLRATAARLLNGLPALALRLGIDAYEAALITGELSLVPRSRFFYLRSDADLLRSDTRRFFDELGFGDPTPTDTLLAFGSQVTPSVTSVQQVHQRLHTLIEDSRPNRRANLDQLVVHHNRFIIGAAWLLTFSIGSRAMKRLDFAADRCWPGVTLMEYRDKRSGPFHRLLPVFLCQEARRQVEATWDHLVVLVNRLSRTKGALPGPWLQHFDDILSQRPVPLLFLLQRGRTVPVGTAHCQLGVDHYLRLAPNAGRHFWQTTLHTRGVASGALDAWARHSHGGVEPFTSTSMISIDAMHQQVCRIQDAVLQDMGIRAFQGLAAGGHR